jgi:hypothetical protein
MAILVTKEILYSTLMKSDLHDLKNSLWLMENGSSKVQETNKILLQNIWV